MVLGCGLAMGVLYLYWPVLAKLISNLAHSEDDSFGLLLPLVSGYIIYLKWPEIRRRPWQPSWAGLVVLAFGLSIYIVGELAAELYTTRFSFVVVLTGLLCLAGGWKLVRLLGFPLLLLVLMLPLPELITNKLTLPLQLISSQFATDILQLLGIPVLRQGNIIDLGTRQLQVVSACSGLRYILALLALGCIYCYFYQRRTWKVTVLLAALVPMAILANSLRVTSMAFFPSLLKGFWHGFSGWLIFLFCLAALAMLDWVLNKIWPQTIPATSHIAESSRNPLVTEDSRRMPTTPVSRYLLAGLALVILAIPVFNRVSVASPVSLRQSFDHFPRQFGQWHGHLEYIDPEMVKATRSQAHLNMAFSDANGRIISLWIAFYQSQKKAGGFVHSPKGCLPASGWDTVGAGIYKIAPSLAVNYMLVEKMGSRLVVFYWYVQRGRWLSSEYLNKFYMGYDGLIRGRTDGAIIRLITPAGKNVEAAQECLASFARQLAKVLPDFIPD